MSAILGIFFFGLGMIVASFCGLAAARLHTGQSVARGRSRCDRCGAVLSPVALIPVCSYVFAGGRALCCRARLSPLAPLSELALGAVFLGGYLTLGLSLALSAFLCAAALLFVLVLYDLAHQILPPQPLAFFLAAAALTGILSAPSLRAFGASVLTALALALFLGALNLGSRGRLMGFSDAPLAFGLSLLVGPAALSGFVFSFWIGALIGILVLARRPRGSRMGIEVPFAPFLAAGFLLAYFSAWNPFALVPTLFAALW